MTITIRKVRGKDLYAIKEDGKLLKSFEHREDAIKYFEEYSSKKTNTEEPKEVKKAPVSK
jgi:hypothetical protein